MHGPQESEVFKLAPDEMRAISNSFGTPTYVFDERTIINRAERFRDAVAAHFPNFELTFASKSNGNLSILRLLHGLGFAIDVASEGELRAALSAGIGAEHCHFHGSYKLQAELSFALESGIGQIIVDHPRELPLIAGLPHGKSVPVFIRLKPDVRAETHEKISTGHKEAKFGLSIENGEAEAAVAWAKELGLNLIGFHMHIGSQIMDSGAFESGARSICAFTLRMRAQFGFELDSINFGGGYGVRYIEGQPPCDLDGIMAKLLLVTREAFGEQLPTVYFEPGRFLVAESCVSLYRAGAIKDRGDRRLVSIDGGLADNPRPALYDAPYTVLHERGDSNAVTWDVFGRHCESDLIFPNAKLPADLGEGDLLQVLCSGAYQLSMASNYNRFLRPAVVMRRTDGRIEPIARRETYDQLFANEQNPS